MQRATRTNRRPVSKACDACRRRKIKCNGSQPCSGCLSSDLMCTFKSPRGLGGNRGARATVLNELRAKQDGNEALSFLSSPRTLSNTDGDVSVIDAAITFDQHHIDACIHMYLDHIHQVVPLLNEAILKTEASQMDASRVSRQFMIAFCAYVVTFGKLTDEGEPTSSFFTNPEAGKHTLETALLAQDLGRVTRPTPHSVYISFFLYGAYAGQGDYRQAWFYLREATTLFMMLKTGGHPWYDESAQRSMFWVLVISERSHAVRRNRPITLQITPSSPQLASFGQGMLGLASIFRPLDEIFFAVWNGSTRDCSKDWLLRLEHDVRTVVPPVLHVSNGEIANIRVTQFWLQIKLWELFPRFGFLSTESVYECLTFRYPIVIARDITVLAMKLPLSSLQLHGVGMTEKIFDIACALADVLPFVSSPVSQLELSPSDYLTQTISLVAKLPGGSNKFVPLLIAKVKELLPDLVKPICEVIELPHLAFDDPMSPDTRFIYEEEVGRGLYTDLRRGLWEQLLIGNQPSYPSERLETIRTPSRPRCHESWRHRRTHCSPTYVDVIISQPPAPLIRLGNHRRRCLPASLASTIHGRVSPILRARSILSTFVTQRFEQGDNHNGEAQGA
ncbi:hypothetical protein LEMA_P060710.1 [Plenodomus lingam JN3]|uniref:Zn(2)-C6 fungal-type domain-containing protein n=1 Tax=Leptosphaeria maculans (strain JN3 / isolate v23.1.3 / race Av1-4-5-6-7-8) TaxID=985895 RepID=E4ZIL6_LEPMJ|nr:hypothetical protein LEMA_P060710.1 [Plenodomus lingam JN3]CBX91037.1 hypothetical protein LEMA_P060710.1 [Plenodomus lingam JN3]